MACLDTIDQQPLNNRSPLILVHGWNHEAIPGVPSPHERLREKEEFEKAIDEAADIYLDDSDLMEYIRQGIPVFQDNKEST